MVSIHRVTGFGVTCSNLVEALVYYQGLCHSLFMGEPMNVPGYSCILEPIHELPSSCRIATSGASVTGSLAETYRTLLPQFLRCGR